MTQETVNIAWSGWLEAFRLAVTGPLAAFVFLMAALALAILTLRRSRLQKLWDRIENVPAKDRARVTVAEMGTVFLEQGVTANDWLKHKAQSYKFQAFLVVIVAFVFLFVTAVDNRATRIKIVSAMLENARERTEALEWLRSEYGLYHVDEPRLADSLASYMRVLEVSLRDSTPAGRFRTLSSIIDERALLRELRRRAEGREPPFEPLGTMSIVGLPREPTDRPKACEVNVEMDSPLVGGPLQVVNPRNQRRLLLMPKARIVPQGYSQPLVHLNSAQVSFLYPSGIANTEQAVLVPQPTATELRDPSSTGDCRSAQLAFD